MLFLHCLLMSGESFARLLEFLSHLEFLSQPHFLPPGWFLWSGQGLVGWWHLPVQLRHFFHWRMEILLCHDLCQFPSFRGPKYDNSNNPSKQEIHGFESNWMEKGFFLYTTFVPLKNHSSQHFWLTKDKIQLLFNWRETILWNSKIMFQNNAFTMRQNIIHQSISK